LAGRALATIRRRKLAAIIELSLDVASADLALFRQVAICAAEHGFAIRVRVHGNPRGEPLDLIQGASPVALIAAPVEPTGSLVKLATMGCVHVLQATAAIREGWNGAGTVRRDIDEGIPMAIASGFRAGAVTSQNPQFLLHLAVERFGMTAEEAIVASTYNAACSLRMSHVTGSLEPGKAGDLLVMDVSDYRDLIHRVGHNDVQLAMRSGNVVNRRGALTLD
jgi:imidazolonepropionase